MSDLDPKKLSRADLLSMLLAQRRENESLRLRLAQAQEELADRRISMDKAGSIAEASLQISGIFQAAEAACTQYTENLRALSEAQQSRFARLEQECQTRCAQMEQETTAKCEKMIREAREQSQAYWDAVSAQIFAQNSSYEGLLQLQKPSSET